MRSKWKFGVSVCRTLNRRQTSAESGNGTQLGLGLSRAYSSPSVPDDKADVFNPRARIKTSTAHREPTVPRRFIFLNSDMQHPKKQVSSISFFVRSSWVFHRRRFTLMSSGASRVFGLARQSRKGVIQKGERWNQVQVSKLGLYCFPAGVGVSSRSKTSCSSSSDNPQARDCAAKLRAQLKITLSSLSLLCACVLSSCLQCHVVSMSHCNVQNFAFFFAVAFKGLVWQVLETFKRPLVDNRMPTLSDCVRSDSCQSSAACSGGDHGTACSSRRIVPSLLVYKQSTLPRTAGRFLFCRLLTCCRCAFRLARGSKFKLSNTHRDNWSG